MGKLFEWTWVLQCFKKSPSKSFSLLVYPSKERLFIQTVLSIQIKQTSKAFILFTGKKNRFPFLDILGHLKNTHKNPKFGRVRQVPIRELGWEFPGWDLSHFAKFGIFMGIL